MRVQLFPVPLRMVDRKKDREGGREWGWGRMEASCSNAHGDGRTDGDPNAKEGKGRREWLMHTKAAKEGEKEPPCFSEFKHSEHGSF